MLILLGLLTSAFGILVKSLPITLKTTEAFKNSIFMDIAASVVDPTLIGLAGGLIGSAFILKIQILYDQEKAGHERRRDFINDAKRRLAILEEELREDVEVSEGERELRKKQISELRTEVILDEMELRADVGKLENT